MEEPKLDIHLYMTTHGDELPDLHTMEHTEEVKAWFAQVDDVAVHHDHFDKIDDKMIAEAKKHHIMNCHSIVFYPPGKMLEANAIGRNLKEFFHKHHRKSDWHIAPNPSLTDKYEVYLEVIVKIKEDDSGGGGAAAKSESLADRNKRILEDAHTEENPKPGLQERLEQKPNQ